MENEFPPNSHSQRAQKPERRVEKVVQKKEVTRVTKSKATLRKKSLSKRFFEAFRPEDRKGFAEYVVLEMLVPGIKDTIADSANAAIDNALGVGGGGRRRGRGGGGGYTSYNRMSSARPRGLRDRDEDRRPGRRESRETRVADDVREIILDSRAEAEEVVDSMIELISNYDVATMRDLLSLIGEPHNQTHEDWGWFDLRGTRIHRAGGGYLIDLPRPEHLD